jgi:hypothetical protein
MFSMRTEDPEPLPGQHGQPFPNARGLSGIHPLLLWRAKPAHTFEFADGAALRAILQAMTLLHEPKWRDAVSGDPAAAVSIAVVMFPVDQVTLRTDLVMSALCLNALWGSSASALVLAHVLNFLGRLHDDSFLPLGASWSSRSQAHSVGSAPTGFAGAGSGRTARFRGPDGSDGNNLILRLDCAYASLKAPRPEKQLRSPISESGS